MLADDLTGACDAGVQFAAQGFSSVVRLDPKLEEAASCDLLVVTTNSRNDQTETARAKVARACQELISEGREVIYKKIDSTLRGNVAAEIETVMETCGYSLALVAPAFPAAGRKVAEGLLHVAGSNAGIHVPTLLRQQGMENVLHFGRATLEMNSPPVTERLKKISAAGKAAITFDAETDDDLAAIARAGIELRSHALLAGSAGLASAVSRLLAEKSGESNAPRSSSAPPEKRAGPVLLILGSTNPVTKAQVEYLAQNRPVKIVTPGADSLREAVMASRQDRTLLVRLDPAREDSKRLEEFLRALVRSPLGGVTLSGGDTAWTVCRAFAARGIALEREVLPGIPCGRFIGGLADGTAVVTKAGGFGSEDALAAIVDFLTQRGRSTT